MSDQSNLTRDDRDLLIELRTEMKAVRTDIKDLKDNTAFRVSQLEQGKMDKSDAEDTIKDFETRLRFVEKYVWGAIAIIGLLEIVGISLFFDLFGK